MYDDLYLRLFFVFLISMVQLVVNFGLKMILSTCVSWRLGRSNDGEKSLCGSALLIFVINRLGGSLLLSCFEYSMSVDLILKQIIAPLLHEI